MFPMILKLKYMTSFHECYIPFYAKGYIFHQNEPKMVLTHLRCAMRKIQRSNLIENVANVLIRDDKYDYQSNLTLL